MSEHGDPRPEPVIQLARGCPNPGGCACLGICHELVDVVPAADYWRVVGERDEARRAIASTRKRRDA